MSQTLPCRRLLRMKTMAVICSERLSIIFAIWQWILLFIPSFQRQIRSSCSRLMHRNWHGSRMIMTISMIQITTICCACPSCTCLPEDVLVSLWACCQVVILKPVLIQRKSRRTALTNSVRVSWILWTNITLKTSFWQFDLRVLSLRNCSDQRWLWTSAIPCSSFFRRLVKWQRQI